MKRIGFHTLFRFVLVILLSGIIFPSYYPSDTNIDTNAKIKAMFVYNFTKYVEWPENYRQGNFIIGIIGKNNISTELFKMAESKKAGSQLFEIKSFASADQIEKCHILLISPEAGANLSEIAIKIKNYSTLLITEKAGLTKQGAAINFVIQNNKQAFELNKTNAEKHHLKVSSSLINLAVMVE